jgi:hypothetical protein
MVATLFLVRPSKRVTVYPSQRDWLLADTGSTLGMASGVWFLVYLFVKGVVV